MSQDHDNSASSDDNAGWIHKEMNALEELKREGLLKDELSAESLQIVEKLLM